MNRSNLDVVIKGGKKFIYKLSEYSEKDHKYALKHYGGGEYKTDWNGWNEYVKQCELSESRNKGKA